MFIQLITFISVLNYYTTLLLNPEFGQLFYKFLYLGCKKEKHLGKNKDVDSGLN